MRRKKVLQKEEWLKLLDERVKTFPKIKDAGVFFGIENKDYFLQVRTGLRSPPESILADLGYTRKNIETYIRNE